jgi:hypothetical protein
MYIGIIFTTFILLAVGWMFRPKRKVTGALPSGQRWREAQHVYDALRTLEQEVERICAVHVAGGPQVADPLRLALGGLDTALVHAELFEPEDRELWLGSRSVVKRLYTLVRTPGDARALAATCEEAGEQVGLAMDRTRQILAREQEIRNAQ